MNICYHCLRVRMGGMYPCAGRHHGSHHDWDETKFVISKFLTGWDYDWEKPKEFEDNRKLFLNEI